MQIINIICGVLGLVAGAGIGYVFGLIQEAAQRRNQRREESGKFKSAWFVMPGSAGRIVFLLLALVLVQVICPLLFKNGIQWSVSAGVVAGYGFVLYSQLRQKLSGNKLYAKKN
jgi:hypothetical protein